ncbi:MAG: hypothetical protein NTY19_11240 [Planctomycetota bacterium]|nr:hypothetical protein [Planctomycetota bacterium]
MEFFNQWSPRLAPHLRWLKPTSWLASVVLGLAVAGAVLLFARKPGRPAYEPLLSGQTCSPRDIAKMTATFRKAGLPETQVEGDQIHVPAGRREAYLATLDASNALPADFDEALERYVAKSNPFASHQQNEVGYKYAIQMKLAKIVAGMRGVETASVQYDEVKQPGFPPTIEKRALVAVRPSGNRPLEYDHIEAIRDTVTGSIGGLERSRVTVTDLAAGRAYPGNPEHRASHLASQFQAATQRALEKEFCQKIEQRLAKYPDVVVGVSVHFSPPSIRHSSDTTPPAEAPPPLTPALVSASIDVPKSYFKRVWNDRNSAASRRVPDARELRAIEAEVQQTLERAVAALLPPPTAHLPAVPQVTVTSYDDLTPLAASAVGLPSTLTAGLVWYWPILGCGAVVLVSWLTWRGRQGTAAGAPRHAAAPTEIGASHAADAAATEPACRPCPVSAPTHRELTNIIQRDPVAAAQVLRHWIGEAA